MGFVIFTGKEDHAAWSLFRAWKKLKPELFYHLLGFYTRNYFRFDQNLSQPAKDLRIFDPSLKHILSIDHNERWVLQPHLNFKIPGFGADSYLNSLKNMRHQRAIHRGLLPFVANQIENCALKVIQGGYGRQIHYCFQAKLGTLSSTAGSELFLYSETIKNRMRLDPTSILQFFHQETHIEKQRILSAPFVQYQNFKEVRLPRSSKLPKNPN